MKARLRGVTYSRNEKSSRDSNKPLAIPSSCDAAISSASAVPTICTKFSTRPPHSQSQALWAEPLAGSSWNGTRLVAGGGLSVSRLGRLQHGVAFGLEFCPRLPFGHHVAVCHAITYEKVKLSVLNGAAHIPIGLTLVGRLVVVLGRISPLHLQAPALGS